MTFEARQVRLLAILLTLVVAVLVVLWLTIFRTNFVPVYQNIRQSDASAIIAELENAAIPYRLANEGHDVLVPEDQESKARVTVAGSDISFGGTVGFELFNESDMGLTEFAQKINFQRAIQGELSRTIMMMDGVAFARVHLAIPERSIFRSGNGNPTAAVTLEMRPGVMLSSQRIVGVRQLVASSVPGLSTLDVAILDGKGDLVSESTFSDEVATEELGSALSAIRNFYEFKLRRAIDDTLPGLRFKVDLSTRPATSFNSPPEEDQAEAGARGIPELEDYALTVIVRTPQLLGDEERSAINSALVNVLAFARARGDRINFTTGALPQALPATRQPAESLAIRPQSSTEVGSINQDQLSELGQSLSPRTSLILLGLIFLLTLVVWPRRRLAKEEVENFADLLKSSSQHHQEANNA